MQWFFRFILPKARKRSTSGSRVFESIYNPGKMLLLTSWKTAEDAQAWTPSSFAGVSKIRHRRLRNIRDYGMFERREAAQYYPEAQRK